MRGSFTGATDTRPGLFEYANSGTVFLDEIGETSLQMQAKLLRVIQNREIQRVGSPEVKKDRRPIDRGDEPRPARRSSRRQIPRGSLLPAEQHRNPRSGPLGTPGRYSGSDPAFPEEIWTDVRKMLPGPFSPRSDRPVTTRLAGKRSRTRERDFERRDHCQRRLHRRQRSADPLAEAPQARNRAWRRTGARCHSTRFVASTSNASSKCAMETAFAPRRSSESAAPAFTAFSSGPTSPQQPRHGARPRQRRFVRAHRFVARYSPFGP